MKKRKFIKALIIVAIVTFIIVETLAIRAGQGSYEPMIFDDSGRLSFEAIDNPAVHVAYKTIGWTIKRYDLSIDDPNNMTITCSLSDESYVAGDGKVHTTFYVEKTDILAKAEQISSEWAAEMRMVGGVAYLDNIMTVLEYGEPTGQLYDDGSSEGEVYDTYEGIASARGWRNPEDLHQYFDRIVIIKADEVEHPGDSEINDETYQVSYYNCNDVGLEVDNAGYLYSNVYDVEIAIPSGEPVIAEGEFSKYAYKLEYRKVTGNKTYEVCVNVSATLVWIDADGKENAEDISYEQWYSVTRYYTAYEIKNLTLYHLQKWNIHNDAFGSISIHNSDYPLIQKQYNFHINEPEFDTTIYVDEGVITGDGNYRPSMSFGDYEDEAEAQVGEYDVESDTVMVDSETILGNSGAKLPAIDSKINLRNGIATSSTISNGSKSSQSTYIYSVQEGSSDGKRGDLSVNDIHIHTPVVSNSIIYDNRIDNQMVAPIENRYSMILDKNFWVNVGNTGLHIDARGYGYRDYSDFALNNEVRFPFDVERNGITMAAGSWISIGKHHTDNQFHLPVYIEEGEYTIDMRCLASNYDADNRYQQELNANLSEDYYVAYSNSNVYVSGQIKEFTITNITDKKYTNNLPIVRIAASKLPIRNPALRQGHGLEFELTTVGDIWEEGYVLIEPTYKIIPYDGSEAFEVDLYLLNEKNSTYTFDKVTNKLEEDFMLLIESDDTGHIRKWQGYYALPARVYAVKKGFDLMSYYETHILHDNSELWERKGYIDINFNISTIVNAKKRLNYANLANASIGYCNMWKQEKYQLQSSYTYGDVVLYLGERNFMEDYEIVGTH